MDNDMMVDDSFEIIPGAYRIVYDPMKEKKDCLYSHRELIKYVPLGVFKVGTIFENIDIDVVYVVVHNCFGNCTLKDRMQLLRD